MPYTPWLDRNIGVEMEMNQHRDGDGRSITAPTLKRALSKALEDLGLSQSRLNDRDAGYFHSRGETWDVKTDSSCGWEIASPILRLNEVGENEELRGVCTRLEQVGPQIDRTCGHHLHIDISDLHWQEVQRLCWLWARYEPFLFELVNTSRRGNSYCPALCRVNWPDNPMSHWRNLVPGLTSSSRETFQRHSGYFPRGALNIGSWWQNGRVEVRLHHGTISYAEIRDWAMLMTSLVARVKQARLPEIKPYTPSPREAGFHTYYIWKAFGLARQREHSDLHPGIADLFTRISNRRIALNPTNRLNVLPYRNREMERLRTLAREVGIGAPTVPSVGNPVQSGTSWTIILDPQTGLATTTGSATVNATATSAPGTSASQTSTDDARRRETDRLERQLRDILYSGRRTNRSTGEW